MSRQTAQNIPRRAKGTEFRLILVSRDVATSRDQTSPFLMLIHNSLNCSDLKQAALHKVRGHRPIAEANILISVLPGNRHGQHLAKRIKSLT